MGSIPPIPRYVPRNSTNLALDVAGRCGAACRLRNLVPGTANWLELDNVAANLHNWTDGCATSSTPELCENRLRLTIDGGLPTGINSVKAPVDSAVLLVQFCAPTPTPTLGPSDCCQCDSSCAAPEDAECGDGCPAVRQAVCSDTTCATFTPTPPPASPTPTPTPLLGSCALSEGCSAGACVPGLTEADCLLRAIDTGCERLSWSPAVTDCSAPAPNTGCCVFSGTDGPLCAGPDSGGVMGLSEAGCRTLCQTIADRISGCAVSVWGYDQTCGDSPYSGCVPVNTPSPSPTPT